MHANEIADRINELHPGRDWHMECQALAYWVGVAVTGSEKGRRTYGRAIWAYDASHIESLDPLTAPDGSYHYWLYPAGHGHVAVQVAGRTIMSGTKHELGAAGVMLGTNFGTTTVASFMARGTQTYLGWSKTNGDNPSLLPFFTKPAPEEEDEDDDMWKPTVHLLVGDKGEFIEGTLAHPEIGRDLTPGESRKETTKAGVAYVYRGFKASADVAVVAGWQAAYAKGPGTASSPGAKDRKAYQNMQAAQQQMSVDVFG